MYKQVYKYEIWFLINGEMSGKWQELVGMGI